MKSFFWKFLVCFVPVGIACWIVADGWTNNKFKWGVDLSGGTILVYEIDTRKLEDQQKKDQSSNQAAQEESTVDYAKRTASKLSASLKKRIDPTGTYNIVVRPAGSEGRVEIILPFGSAAQAEKAEEAWRSLLKDLKSDKRFGLAELNVPRGRFDKLVEEIRSNKAQETWKTRLLNDQEAWDRIMDKLVEGKKNYKEAAKKEYKGKGWPGTLLPNPTTAKRNAKTVVSQWGTFRLLPAAGSVPVAVTLAAPLLDEFPLTRLRAIPPGDIEQLANTLESVLQAVPRATIDNRIRQFAWEELIYRITDWTVLQKNLKARVEKEFKKKFEQQFKAKSGAERTKAVQAALQKQFDKEKADLKKSLLDVPVDSFHELIGRVETQGHVLGLAVLDAVEPLLGRVPNVPVLVKRNTIDEFVTRNYGPSEETIREFIDKKIEGNTALKESAKELSLEDVQRIKDLVARVGALQFQILANEYDDSQAIRDMQQWFNDAKNNKDKEEDLERRALEGSPPLGPMEQGATDRQKKYLLKKLPNNHKSYVTYSWVEIGKQERKVLGLDNAAQFSTSPYLRGSWETMNAARQKNQASQLDKRPPDDVRPWQGALIYSRECKNRSLPEKERQEKKYEYFVLARDPEYVDSLGRPDAEGKQYPITGEYLARAYRDTSKGRPEVGFIFHPEGANLFGTLTRKNIPSGVGTQKVKRHLAIILDGLVMSAPTINSEIRDRGVITGSFTVKEVDDLVMILQSGALPATLKADPVSESTIGSLLGQDTIRAGAYAIVISLGLVLVFMLVYYQLAGVVACIAMFSSLVLTIGFMVFVKATFTLPGLAGLVLMLGMAVDALVLIFERIREERDRGASLAISVRNGYERALPTILDTHITSIFTAIVLYWVGNDQLKGFGISLTVGLIISLFASLFMSRVLFDFFLARGLKRLGMFRILSNPGINFMSARHAVFSASVGITLVGLAIFMADIEENLGIDFRGGTAFSAQLTQPVTIGDMRAFLDESRQDILLKVKDVKEVDDDGQEFLVTYKFGDKIYPVHLVNPAPGNDTAERIAHVKAAASRLKGVSVEMLYPSTELEKPDVKKAIEKARQEKDSQFVSPFFTVRTAQKERDLVAVMLNQLLQDETSKKELVKRVTLDSLDKSRLGGKKQQIVTINFSGPASPSYVQGLLKRELRKQFPHTKETKKTGGFEFRYRVEGRGVADETGRFTTMAAVFEGLKPEQVAKVEAAIAGEDGSEQGGVIAAFNRRPQPLRLENFDSELAADTRLAALGAIFASWLAIVLYLWFRFGNWTFGLAAVLCLVHDLCFTLGLVAISSYVYSNPFGQMLLLEDFKIDFTAVAALLTLVGYSVNDTIVVFDRIREVRGKNPELTPQIINESINQTLSRTLITSLTTFLVVFVLYCIGGTGIRLFAFIMCAGVLIGTLSSIFIACPLLLMLGEGKITEKERDRARRAQAAGATV